MFQGDTSCKGWSWAGKYGRIEKSNHSIIKWLCFLCQSNSLGCGFVSYVHQILWDALKAGHKTNSSDLQAFYPLHFVAGYGDILVP